MPCVLIGPATLMEVEGEYRRVLRDAGFDFVFPPRPNQMTEDEVIARLNGCTAMLAGSEPITRKVLDANPQLKVIARSGVGYDAVDVPACTERGIPVMIAPGNAEGVAEHTFALILCLAKHVIPQHLAIGKGGWPRRSNLPLRGTTLAIAGLGRIGKAVAMRGLAFGMRVIAYDPYPDRDFAVQHKVELRDYEDLFIEGDHVTLHLPLNEASKHGVCEKQLNMMKKTAFLINTSRGSVINEPELYEFLKEGKIAGAGLDVFEQEPPAKDNPILQLPNVVQTAHTAGVDSRSRDDMALIAAKGIVEFLSGGWPKDIIVNPECRK